MPAKRRKLFAAELQSLFQVHHTILTCLPRTFIRAKRQIDEATGRIVLKAGDPQISANSHVVANSGGHGHQEHQHGNHDCCEIAQQLSILPCLTLVSHGLTSATVITVTEAGKCCAFQQLIARTTRHYAWSFDSRFLALQLT